MARPVKFVQTGPWVAGDVYLEWPDGVPKDVLDQFHETRGKDHVASVWFSYGPWSVRVGLTILAGRVEAVQAEVLVPPSRRRPLPLAGSQLRIPWAWVFDQAKREYANWAKGHLAPTPTVSGMDLGLDPTTELGKNRAAVAKMRGELSPKEKQEESERRRVAFWQPKVEAAERALRNPGGGRPPLYDVDHWVKVAEVYRAAVQDGSRTPTKVVREHFVGVTKDQAAKWVARCRDLKLLPAAPGPGRAGMKRPREKEGTK